MNASTLPMTYHILFEDNKVDELVIGICVTDTATMCESEITHFGVKYSAKYAIGLPVVLTEQFKEIRIYKKSVLQD